MILHRTLIHFIYFLCYSSIFSNSYVLIYHTENSPSLQYYDCIYYTRSQIQNNIRNIKYCRRLNVSQSLQRDFNQSCHNGGQLWPFEKLSLLHISVSDVLQWSSSIEQTNQYSKYLSNNSLDAGGKYICNCTNPASFGKFCEYEFYGSSISFNDSITKQFEPLINVGMYVGSQLHDNRPCYTTWTCNSGLMCLDWRHICDGKQKCMNGLDEDYCEALEFNECEDDEYRCANGMCIPEEYWLDGDYDCMDWTDEIKVTVSSGSNCFEIPSFICDEHLCTYNQWSCGDGQCVNDQTDRHRGIRINKELFCLNMRDVSYMCESVTRYSKSWWTINGGYCLPYSLSYKALGLDTTSVHDKCSFSLKCALSNSLDQDCKCKKTTECRNVVIGSCKSQHLFYPRSGPVLSPYVFMQYTRNHSWTDKKPGYLAYQGRVKCIGYQLITNGARRWSVSKTFDFYRYYALEKRLCNMQEGTQGNRNYSGPHYDINCWNNSKTFNNRSYQVSFQCNTRCISKYRVRDGILDCSPSDELSTINNSCPQIQRHRLQCSSSELTCLIASELGSWGSACSNGRDEFDYETGTVLFKNLMCQRRDDPQCVYLRNYIQISSDNTAVANNFILDDHSTTAIPFRLYCNSFFNIKSGIDESPQFCEEWICFRDEYQCVSGQCISQSWVCDGEWDCSDGSDEQRIFILDRFNDHNSKLMNLTKIKEQCYQQYRSNNTPFSDICNISSEYPCFRNDIDDPFNLTLNRPCINLTQVGDGKTDCWSDIDERNRLQCLDWGMLGLHIRLNDSFCVTYTKQCTASYPWTRGTNIAYDTVCFHQEKQFKNGTVSSCNSLNDVMCLNDICLKNARCNGKIECLHGEDEYRCISQGRSQQSYRSDKKAQFKTLRLQNYPSLVQSLPEKYSYHRNGTDPGLSLILDERNSLSNLITRSESVDYATTVFATRNSKVKSVYEIVRDSLPNGTITFEKHYLPFICNRGIAVKYYTGDTICLCPPSFYGSQCEFYSDRITVLTHLDLTNYWSSFHQIAVIKVLATFLFKDQIIDYYEFHVNPQLENETNYIKHSIYLLYPRTEVVIQMKNDNRSGTQLYSVRFEAFDLHLNGKIEPIGIWKYPIYFDFISAFRFSKILRFRPPVSSLPNSPCLTNPCGKNGVCLEIINLNRSSYFCSCNSGYYGIHCESYDKKCNNYCSLKSICKPKHRGNLIENQHPLCLCPASTFGTSCYLQYESCQNNPCLYGGSCIITYKMTDTNNYTCLCTDLFTGDHCQFPKGMVNITFVLSSDSTLKTYDVVAMTVSYNDYQIPSLRFNVLHQQVYDILPSHLNLIYSEKLAADAPTTAVLKVYGLDYQNEEPEYYILYFQPGQKEINITADLTSENHCSLVQTLWHLIQTNETTSKLEYFITDLQT